MSEQGAGGATPAEPGCATPPTPDPSATHGVQTPPPEPAREPGQTEPDDPREAALGDEGKALLRDARKNAREAERELKALRDEKRAREDANKTELQRAQEAAAEATARADAAERRILSVEVAT